MSICQGRIKYRQEKRARVLARDQRRRTPWDPLYHHLCRVCGFWHLARSKEAIKP